jgi:hypothetical protein
MVPVFVPVFVLRVVSCVVVAVCGAGPTVLASHVDPGVVGPRHEVIAR